MDGSVITDWGAAVMTSLTAALSLFLAAIPRVIGFLVILVIGWLIRERKWLPNRRSSDKEDR